MLLLWVSAACILNRAFVQLCALEDEKPTDRKSCLLSHDNSEVVPDLVSLRKVNGVHVDYEPFRALELGSWTFFVSCGSQHSLVPLDFGPG